MGLFSLFAPSPEKQIEKARRSISKGRFIDAKELLEGLDHPEAAEALAEANNGLISLNLREAEGCINMGDPQGAKEHLELAKTFGATEDQVRGVRRIAREARAASQQKEAEAAQAQPGVEVVGNDPIWSLPPDDPRVRYAMMVEGYPTELRAQLLALGPEFAAAVLLIEDGEPKAAFERLTPFVEAHPIVRVERARAALGAGMHPAAISDLQSFGQTLGHAQVGNLHTATLLAQLLGQVGRTDEGLEVCRTQLAVDERVDLRGVEAGLLEATAQYDAAEKAIVALLRKVSNNLSLYRALARVRVQLGNRMGAMQALEGGLSKCCSSPGKCGNQAPDVDNLRLLTQLYLEDRIEEKRTHELLEQLGGMVKEPNWQDHYIMALRARNEGHPNRAHLAKQVQGQLSPTDPRQKWLAEAFPETCVSS